MILIVLAVVASIVYVPASSGITMRASVPAPLLLSVAMMGPATVGQVFIGA